MYEKDNRFINTGFNVSQLIGKYSDNQTNMKKYDNNLFDIKTLASDVKKLIYQE